MADLTLDELAAAVRKSQNAFAIAALCLRYSYQELRNESTFDAADPRIDRMCAEIVKIINHGNAPLLDGELIASYIENSAVPALAARAATVAISAVNFNDFASSFSQTAAGPLAEGDVIPIPANAAAEIYGRGNLTMYPDEARNRFDASRTTALAVWTMGSGANSVQVEVDYAAAAYMQIHLAKPGDFCIALAQPNSDLADFAAPSFSQKSARHYFFGLAAHDPQGQEDTVLALLRHADKAAGGLAPKIAVLPELAGSKDISKAIGGETFASIEMVVAPSYHVVAGGLAANVADVIFPRKPKLSWQHGKTGLFKFKMTSEFATLLAPGQSGLIGKTIYEEIEPSRRIRLLLGDRVSLVVLICADLLESSIQEALRQLRPTLIIVSSMTYTVDDFKNVGGAMVAAGQSTMVMVNNPANWTDQIAPPAVVCTFPTRGDVLEDAFVSSPGVKLLDLAKLNLRPPSS